MPERLRVRRNRRSTVTSGGLRAEPGFRQRTLRAHTQRGLGQGLPRASNGTKAPTRHGGAETRALQQLGSKQPASPCAAKTRAVDVDVTAPMGKAKQAHGTGFPAGQIQLHHAFAPL